MHPTKAPLNRNKKGQTHFPRRINNERIHNKGQAFEANKGKRRLNCKAIISRIKGEQKETRDTGVGKNDTKIPSPNIFTGNTNYMLRVHCVKTELKVLTYYVRVYLHKSHNTFKRKKADKV